MPRKFLASVGAAAVVIAVLSPSVPASASTSVVESGYKTVSYSKSAKTYSSVIKRCVRVTATGTMKVLYVRSKDYLGNDMQSLTNPVISSPKLQLTTTTSCGTSKRGTVSGVSLTQSYSYYKCEAGLSYSVGAPLSVGVSWTPVCGTRNAIKRSTSGYGKNSYFVQGNTGATGTVKKVVLGRTASTVTTCVAVGAVVNAKNPSNISDNLKLNLGKICVSV